MKKVVLITALFMAFVVGANAQIITNGDFETGDLSGWTVTSGEIDTSEPIEGTASYLRGWGNGVLISQTISVEAGKEYTLSYDGWMAYNWIYINAKVIDAADGTTVIAQTDIHMTDNTSASVDFTAPADGSVIIEFSKTADSPGKVRIDNVDVQLKTATAISNVEDNALTVAHTASGEFMVSAENNIASISVYTSSGQLVKQMTNAGASEVTFNLNGQSQGLYILRIVDVRGNVSVKKVVNN